MRPSTFLALTFGAGALAGPSARGFPNLNLNINIGANLEHLFGYELTWHDEFQGKAGSLPSSENWIFDLGTSYPGGAPQWGNAESETYTASPENVHITKSDTLAITPRKNNGKWTSARIETRRSDFVAAPGGKLFVDARVKTGGAPSNSQQGIWPAFWALGESFRGDYTNWPAASEWDFLEVVNGLSTVYNTVHCGTAPGGPCNEYNGLGNGGVHWTGGEWHCIGFEVDRTPSGGLLPLGTWKDERLRWFIDGVQVYELSGAQVNNEEAWDAIAHQGHFLLLNVAVGGNWPGQPNADTVDGEGVQLEVDYVRVWNS